MASPSRATVPRPRSPAGSGAKTVRERGSRRSISSRGRPCLPWQSQTFPSPKRRVSALRRGPLLRPLDLAEHDDPVSALGVHAFASPPSVVDDSRRKASVPGGISSRLSSRWFPGSMRVARTQDGWHADRRAPSRSQRVPSVWLVAAGLSPAPHSHRPRDVIGSNKRTRFLPATPRPPWRCALGPGLRLHCPERRAGGGQAESSPLSPGLHREGYAGTRA